MGRYNTISPTSSTSSATTITVPGQGLLTGFTGTAPYTVVIPNPTIYFGSTNSFYNSTSGVVTIQTPSGAFRGPASSGTSTQTIPAGTTITLASDGVDYIIISENGGPLSATTIIASSTVTLSPVSATVTISPTGTGSVAISPASIGTINNMSIGGSVAADATVNTLTLNTAMSGNGTINGGTF